MPDNDDQEIYPTSESKRAFEEYKQRRAQQRLLASNTGDIIERRKQRRADPESLLDKALSAIERESQANSDLAKCNIELAQTVSQLLGVVRQLGLPLATEAPIVEKGEKPWRPTISEWRKGYDAFRTYMIGVENKLPARLRKHKLEFAARLSRGGSVRRITEAMRHYHLTDDMWPPSTWPEQEPQATGAIARLRGAKIGDLRKYPQVAVLMGVSATLMELLYDGRVDGLLKAACHMVGRG